MNLRHYLAKISLLASFVGLFGAIAGPAYAEGSRDLVSSGGSRPFLEYRNDSNGGILRRTVIRVYVNEGETLNLGSSAVGVGSGEIQYRRPNNTTGTCGIAGKINDISEEMAGPGNGAGGTFVPCRATIGPGESGIWEINFISPNPGDRSNPSPTVGTDPWVQSTTAGLVSAWDVTVTSSAGVAIPGRVYANAYAFNMGGNNGGIQLSSEFHVLTKEGYRYRIDLNSLDPFGFIFFSNRNGFFDALTGDSIFRSLQFTGGNPGALPPGYDLHNPNTDDVGIYVTHKTFINPPDQTMPSSATLRGGTTWLYSDPLPPPVPNNFGFTGIEGTAGQAGTAPLGGTLSFDSTSQNAFSITIDLNQDGIYGNGNDRTFVGRSVFGANSVFWDGLDGNGDKVEPSAIPYTVQINQYAGEAHFPVIDAEQNNSGVIIERLNQPAGSTADPPFNIYYDDRNTGGDFSLCAEGESTTNAGVADPICYGNGSIIREALNGVDSAGGGHEFSNRFGDRRGIDTWVYYPSTDVQLSGGIVIREADLIVDKSVTIPSTAMANPGDPVTYTVTVTNDGPSDEDGITFRDNVPAVITGVQWSCAITSGTGTCNETTGMGNNIETTLDLENQAVATYTITGELAPSASGTISNTAEAERNLDITDPDLSNNVDDAVIVMNAPPLSNAAFCYSVVDSSNRLVKVFLNTGAEDNSIGAIGAIGTVRAIAYRSSDEQLFVANGTNLGVFNTLTSAYSTLGSFGSVGPDAPASVDGLAFHPFTGELFGIARNNSGVDSLIQIDPTTGAFVPGAFTGGLDFVAISVAGSQDIGDIAFDPETGELYAVANDSGTAADQLVKVDPTDGTVTVVGSVGIDGMEGLSFFNDGTLYGTTGDASDPTSDRNRFYSLNKNNGSATLIGSTLTAGTGYESLACGTEPVNSISGTVFLDPDMDGVLNLGGGDLGTANAIVRLYRDANANGAIDGSDILLVSQSTSAAAAPDTGTFSFSFPATGSFVLDVDTATLPTANNVLTTDNVEVANFGVAYGGADDNNDFGHFTAPNLAIVKRITAINGVRLTDSVDGPGDDDNHPNWPAGTTGAGISTFLAGATQYNVEPGDEVEYTIYYLGTGNFPVTNVLLCDRIPAGATYIPDSMILFTSGSTSDLTDTDIDSDGGEFLLVGDSTPLPCSETDTGGTVLVNLAPDPSQLPNATAPGVPTDAYGFIRFRVTVD
ncbi:MAG: hypothetical protein AAFQ63_10290 [Cyanobacteria bacterium J06621_11]